VNDPIPPEIRAEITLRLDAIEREHQVRILVAVESGSRAWGFPSPDSDFDVRFLYVRTAERYLSLQPARDVIETPLEGLWDVNGWDLRKGLQLLHKGNAVVIEWLRSPVIYREVGPTAERMRAMADRYADLGHALRHYYGLMASQYGRDIEGRDRLKLKKYFYSIRAACALNWIRLYQSVPPMDLPALLAAGCAPREIRGLLDDLLVAKAQSHELGQGPRIPELDAFIEAMRDWARNAGAMAPHKADPAFMAAADAIFLQALHSGA
jgi:predicted nucleotidyltransferase